MSAHSLMRRTLFFVLLLLAVSTVAAAAAPVEPAKAHGKAVASSHTASRQKMSRRSSSYAISRKTAKRTRTRMATNAKVRAVVYTPERTPDRTADRTAASSIYQSAYKDGYEAGRAAALRELAGANADPKLSNRPSEPLQTPQATSETTTVRQSAPFVVQPAFGSTTRVRTSAQPISSRAAARSGVSQAEQADQFDEDPPVTANRGHMTASSEADDAAPTEIASLHIDRAGMPTSLRGSLASLQRQNATLDAEGLERILDERDLASRIAHKLLVSLPASSALTVNPNLSENHRYCRPWTARFLSDLARAHQAAFHRSLEVSSAVRTVDYQKRLMTTNGNAAAAEGDIVSPHLTGATIDIAKQGMTRQELAWMRSHLLAIQTAGKIDVEEEFEQACFHISVYKTYAPASPSRKTAEPATNREEATHHKAAPHAGARTGSSLPTSIAVGTFAPQGR